MSSSEDVLPHAAGKAAPLRDGTAREKERQQAFPGPRLSLGNLLSASWATFSKNLGLLFSAFLIASLPGQIALVTFLSSDPVGQAALKYLLFLFAVEMPIYQMAHAVVLLRVISDLQGRPASLCASIAQGLSAFPRLLLTTLLLVLGMLIGLVLLVIPGVIWFLGQFVVVPACVMERTGPIRSLSRSWALTHGHRLTLLALLTIYIAVAYITTAALNEVLATAPVPVVFVLSLFHSALWGALFAATTAQTYFLLAVVQGDGSSHAAAEEPA